MSVALLVGSAAVAQETRTPPPAAPKPGPTTPPASATPTQPAKDLPSASAIIADAIEAMGGRKAIDAIESTSIKGTLAGPMMPGEVLLEIKSAKKNQMLVKQELPGMGAGSFGCDGTTAWKTDPMMGGYQLMAPEESKEILKRSNMYSILWDLEREFKTIQTIDKTTFNEEDCYKIRMVDEDDDTSDQIGYFSVANKLMAGVESSKEGPMGPVTTTFTFKDWKAVDGVKVFMAMQIGSMGMDMDMKFTEVEFNKVDPAVFVLPDEVKKLVEANQDAGAGSNAPAAPASAAPSAPKPQ